ncbi:hypothetical protein [Actinacidiphila glaucinigra]|uniref:hypothetical protein n=1 Tax=Actinacidiphila glaucinigra TaxID=235986 RepID=UPI0015C5DA5E|nr:hypothetical protein [Actinacidiphila glaucinigra]
MPLARDDADGSLAGLAVTPPSTRTAGLGQDRRMGRPCSVLHKDLPPGPPRTIGG